MTKPDIIKRIESFNRSQNLTDMYLTTNESIAIEKYITKLQCPVKATESGYLCIKSYEEWLTQELENIAVRSEN